MNDQNSSPESGSGGFTLVELLVTMALSSALLMILAAIVMQTTDGYALTQRSVNRLSQSRAFIQLLESEISLRLPDTPIVHVSSTPGDPQSFDRIAFVRTLPNNERHPDNPGDLTTSCYYVAFAEDPNQRIIPKLFRKILNPVETQNLMEEGKEAEFPKCEPAMDEPVIDSVLSFQATPIYRNPETGNDELWDKNIALAPSHIELTVRTLDESFSCRFTKQAAWDRLASSPSESERAMIRSVKHKILIGK